MRSAFTHLALIAVFALAPFLVHAQTATGLVTLNYTMPTQNTDESPIPASGPNSLAKVQIWLSLTPWASGQDVSGAPTVETTPGTSSTSQFAASVGATVYARARVCNVAGNCSPTSGQASGTVQAATPGAVVINTITIRLQ